MRLNQHESMKVFKNDLKGDFMAMFLGHIAFILATFAVAIGLSQLQFNQENRRLSSVGSWLLIIVGILQWICVGYYMFHYFYIGNFAQAYPQLSQMMMKMP